LIYFIGLAKYFYLYYGIQNKVFYPTLLMSVLDEVTKQLEQCTPAPASTAVASGSSTNSTVSPRASPPRKRTLFASYEKRLVKDTIVAVEQSPAATVLLYVDALPTLMIQAREAENPWALFKLDKRFILLHCLMERVLCIPATSAPVERVFSHGGLFMRPHRARLGEKTLAALVFSKCNRHLK
jgi:hypothetical protein